MPKEMEMKLMMEARKKGMSKERANAYTYGAMRKQGWKPAKDKKTRMMAVKMMMKGKGK